MRADKAKVVDEVWDDERIASFLNKQPFGDEDGDFSKLIHAYRSMRAADFARFVPLFVDAGGNLAARNKAGATLAEVIKSHKKSGEFIDILLNAQAA